MHSIYEAYCERQIRRKVGESARQDTRVWLERLEAYLAEREIDPARATTDDLEGWIFVIEGGYSGSSVRLALVQAKGAYRYAHRRGLIAADPTVDVQASPMPDKEPRTFSIEELRRITAACISLSDRTLVMLLAYTGMRRAEIRQLTWADIDFPGQTIRVMGKGSKLRLVPLHPALADHLAVVTATGLLRGY